ncbi:MULTISPECIES: EAL domain-containing protein [Rhodopseudomonas]|uniref:putative bifunctional diguanylate cyclase/phosphodiesterase n=1 Tax=Rhodopseudomonas TaxID=1073 RepID=UPI0009BC089D|nr:MULTISPECIES: EAL domain-containing protein [Rhodopseudomonas]MDF3813629.1 EAL domain-containing protein [Rhodopseudomonas sp. BAL398]WOK17031.1 EAL domain-containing protein [Rhodopseudomonas sp. BAL398]
MSSAANSDPSAAVEEPPSAGDLGRITPDASVECQGARQAERQIERDELDLLRDILRALPAAITVQDEFGELLFVNEAAAAQYDAGAAAMSATDAAASLPTVARDQLRRTGIEKLREGGPLLREERLGDGATARVMLTAHRPVRIADRNLLLSSSLDITEQKAVEDALVHRAYFDELTGLPNRSVIERQANAILLNATDSTRFALAFLDIDNFKHVNDYYGHAVGDELLVGVAKRLGMELRETDMLSRISGDEFLLLLNPIQSQDEVADYIEFLLQRLKVPFYIDGSELFTSASIGVSVYPEHGGNYEALRQNADIAMYRVKGATKGEAAIFDVTMERESLVRMALEQSLREAILDKRFCCAFQPKVDIRTREIKGIEALVRLRNDDGVLQAPGTFIDLAVELGLIDDLTHLVLVEIMASIDLINEAFGSGTSISINVAAKQAGNPAFMRSFAAALAATECPERFMVEITEDAFVAKSLFQSEILPLLRQIGVGISIDDFGIGYSSLSALSDITADEIKIDRSFITDIHKRPRSQGILKAIESLGEALGMTVIAEGIESFEELAYLQAATNIRYAQGYYFSKPIFLDELKPPAHAVSDGRPNAAGRQPEAARPAVARRGGSRS